MPRRTPVPPLPASDPLAARAAELDAAANDGGPHAVGFGRALAELEAEGAIRIEDVEFTEVPQEEPEPVPAESTPIRALVPTAADQHLIVGMAALANLDEKTFRARLDVIKRGMERVGIIQRELMEQGVDYGRVPNVPKPFLHQPGAEKLANVYGFAVRQEAERITRKADDDPESPPFAYHVKSFVHLGSTDGPVVAEAHGEANPYEERYRYRFSKPACPVCGKTDTIIRRKTPPQLAGKMQCAAFGNKGGCGTVFEPNDPRLGPQGKEIVPDTDLYGLAETLIQMAAKRSFVAGVRRATGTSGLFSQDEDSPSVIAQSEGSGNGTAPKVETASVGVAVAAGGRVDGVTEIQLTRLFALAKEKGIGGAKIAELLDRLFGIDVEPTGRATTAAVRALSGHEIGSLIYAIETGEVPGEMSDAVAEATYPDDIGAK